MSKEVEEGGIKATHRVPGASEGKRQLVRGPREHLEVPRAGPQQQAKREAARERFASFFSQPQHPRPARCPKNKAEDRGTGPESHIPREHAPSGPSLLDSVLCFASSVKEGQGSF